MSIIDKFKSLFNGFGKDGDSMDSIADISKIETAASAAMR